MVAICESNTIIWIWLAPPQILKMSKIWKTLGENIHTLAPEYVNADNKTRNSPPYLPQPCWVPGAARKRAGTTLGRSADGGRRQACPTPAVMPREIFCFHPQDHCDPACPGVAKAHKLFSAWPPLPTVLLSTVKALPVTWKLRRYICRFIG